MEASLHVLVIFRSVAESDLDGTPHSAESCRSLYECIGCHVFEKTKDVHPFEQYISRVGELGAPAYEALEIAATSEVEVLDLGDDLPPLDMRIAVLEGSADLSIIDPPDQSSPAAMGAKWGFAWGAKSPILGQNGAFRAGSSITPGIRRAIRASSLPFCSLPDYCRLAVAGPSPGTTFATSIPS